MAKSGFCTNEHIVKLALKRYKNNPGIIFKPFMMFREEYCEYMQELDTNNDFSSDEILEMARQNWKMFKKCAKERYKELADMANSQQW